MDAYIIIFRILHIVAAIAWVGSAFFFFFFIEPTAKALGPAAERFMGHMTRERHLVLVIQVLAAVTVIAGAFLYWRDSGGLQVGWMETGPGIGFTVGALAGIAAWVLGLVLVAPTVKRIEAIGDEIRAAGGPPSEQQMARFGKAQHTLAVVGRIDIVLLTIASLAMATARYLSF